MVGKRPLQRSCLTRSLKRNLKRRHKRNRRSGRKNVNKKEHKRELEKNPPKLTYIMQQELRQKLIEVKKKQRESYKPSPLSDYERSLSKSHKENIKARRAGKDVAQLGQQSKQSIDPLTVEEG
jgi:hypothetical protein